MIVIDTHILIWFLSEDAKLDKRDVTKLIQAQQNAQVALSSISIWELAMMNKHNKLVLTKPFDSWLEEALEGIKIIDINPAISIDSVRLPNCEHKDPADRFIISTARIYNAKLMTRDSKIIEYAKNGHVELI